MALEKFSGKVNDPWLSRDDAILRGAVGSEGLDQLISFVQRDDAFAGASGKCTGHFCPCDVSDTDDVSGSRIHYGSDPIGANLIYVAFDQTAGIALVERHQFRPRSATITSDRGPAAPSFAASSFNRSSETAWYRCCSSARRSTNRPLCSKNRSYFSSRFSAAGSSKDSSCSTHTCSTLFFCSDANQAKRRA